MYVKIFVGLTSGGDRKKSNSPNHHIFHAFPQKSPLKRFSSSMAQEQISTT